MNFNKVEMISDILSANPFEYLYAIFFSSQLISVLPTCPLKNVYHLQFHKIEISSIFHLDPSFWEFCLYFVKKNVLRHREVIIIHR